MLAKVLSIAVDGISGYLVDVEVNIASGLPVFTTVGLPETSVKESKERVKAAIINSGYTFPINRITVNLAPADTKKEGTGFDLPIALGILTASKTIDPDTILKYPVAGELSLDGTIKPVKGALAMAIAAQKEGYKGLLLPFDNSKEAAVVDDIDIFPIKNLGQAIKFFKGQAEILPKKININALFAQKPKYDMDFSDVVGQEHVKRAMEIAAAGGHNMIMIGPPGSGKTMLSKCLPGILPPITFPESIETSCIFSISGLLDKDQGLITQRPFRSPHHTISDAGLIGGGPHAKPGEVSLAHNGVLFLDELPEFKKSALETLRQPLEDKKVNIARIAYNKTYPSNFMLIATMNPCPCGYFSSPKHDCRCSLHQIQKYRAKISGPLMDRIDMHVEVPEVSYKDLINFTPAELSSKIRERVIAAREIQNQRFKKAKIFCNAQMVSRHIRKHCRINVQSNRLMESAIEKFGLSARAYNRILKLARTIADMDAMADISLDHISEAIQYRSLDRKI